MASHKGKKTIRKARAQESEIASARGRLPKRDAKLADGDIQEILQMFVYNEFGVIMVTDAEGMIQRISPSVERALGYVPSDVLQRNAYEFIHPEDAERSQRITGEVFQTGRRNRKETIRARHKDGSWRVCEFVARRLHDGYALSFHDVTAPRSADAVLEQSGQILLTALRSSPDSITISRLEDGTLIEVNGSFERLTGHRRSKAIGKTSVELGLWKHPSERSRLEKILKRDGVARDFEADFVTKNGEVRNCLVSAEILELDGERCMLSNVRDITDKKRADEALQWFSEKLQQERQNLVEKESALRQILDHIEEEKATFRKEISEHVKNLLTPIISKLRNRDGALAKKDLDLLESSLSRIVEANIDEFQENYSKLTPREMDICAAIKEGLSSKEIADKFGLSVNTVHKHRQIIRRKLMLNNKEINLAAFLRSR